MTRETKVGLVVAGSFVCLVSVVVWQKLKKDPDDTNPVTLAQITPGNNKPDATTSPPSDTKKAENGVVPVELRVPGAGADPNKIAEPPSLFPNDGNKPQPLPLHQGNLPKSPDLPKSSDIYRLPDDPVIELLKKNTAQLAGNPNNFEIKPPEPVRLADINQFALNNNEPKAKLPLPKDTLTPPPIVPPPLDPPPGFSNKVPGDPLLPLPVGPVDPKKDPPPHQDRVIVGLLDPADPKKVPLPQPVVDLKKDPLPPINSFDPKRDPLLPPPPLGQGSNKPPLVTNPPKTDVPPMGTLGKDLPPLGVTQNPPPLVKNPNAQINVAQVDTYLVQERDTLAVISQKGYGSDKFASAILAYNSKYNPEVNVRDNLGGDNPRLFKGMPLILPAREFLTSRYSHLIQDGPPANPPPVSIKPSTTFAPSPNPNAAPLAKVNTPDPTRRYRVPDQGQYIIEIATKTLGNPSRWSEILRLNPSLRTEYPIPGGTELQLPANANLP